MLNYLSFLMKYDQYLQNFRAAEKHSKDMWEVWNVLKREFDVVQKSGCTGEKIEEMTHKLNVASKNYELARATKNNECDALEHYRCTSNEFVTPCPCRCGGVGDGSHYTSSQPLIYNVRVESNDKDPQHFYRYGLSYNIRRDVPCDIIYVGNFQTTATITVVDGDNNVVFRRTVSCVFVTCGAINGNAEEIIEEARKPVAKMSAVATVSDVATAYGNFDDDDPLPYGELDNDIVKAIRHRFTCTNRIAFLDQTMYYAIGRYRMVNTNQVNSSKVRENLWGFALTLSVEELRAECIDHDALLPGWRPQYIDVPPETRAGA